MITSSISSFGQGLHIDKIEPPNWWVEMETDIVQLMISGEQLTKLRVSIDCPQLEIVQLYDNENPNYAFVDVRVKGSSAAQCELLFSNSAGEQSFPFSVEERNNQDPIGFSKEDVVYLITPDRFANGDTENDVVEEIRDDYDPKDLEKRHGGDLQGIIDHLDYLEELGVSFLWLNPIMENTGVVSYHGYAQTDLYKVDPRFGSNELYRTLVQEAGKRGIGVIQDHVANHIGIEHPWMEDYPTPDWVHGTVDDHLRDKHFMHALTDPNADPHSARMLRDFWFVDSMPDLNQQDPHLAKYLIQNTIWWIEYAGLRGIREDTYPYADQGFMREWAQTILNEYPKLNIVGEIWSKQPAFLAHFQAESQLRGAFDTELPCVMDFPLMGALRDFLEEKGNLNDVYEVISQDFLYPDPENLMVFVGNHDTPRASFIAGRDYNRCKIAHGIALTTRGIPQLLYGEELALYGGESHTELREQFPGGFPAHERSAFEAATRTAVEADMYDYISKLLRLRKQYPTLIEGDFYHYPTEWWNKDVYKYVRVSESNTIIIMANGSNDTVFTGIEDQRHFFKDYRLLHNLINENSTLIEDDMQIELQANEFAIFLLR